jgi:hypothetical protein
MERDPVHKFCVQLLAALQAGAVYGSLSSLVARLSSTLCTDFGDKSQALKGPQRTSHVRWLVSTLSRATSAFAAPSHVLRGLSSWPRQTLTPW